MAQDVIIIKDPENFIRKFKPDLIRWLDKLKTKHKIDPLEYDYLIGLCEECEDQEEQESQKLIERQREDLWNTLEQ